MVDTKKIMESLENDTILRDLLVKKEVKFDESKSDSFEGDFTVLREDFPEEIAVSIKIDRYNENDVKCHVKSIYQDYCIFVPEKTAEELVPHILVEAAEPYMYDN